MKLRDKAFEKAANFREGVFLLASTAVARARERAPLSAEARDSLATTLATLKLAGRELRQVAGLHAAKFVAQNSTLARAAGRDVSALARSTYQQFTQDVPARKPRKAPSVRKVAATRKRGARAGRAARTA